MSQSSEPLLDPPRPSIRPTLRDQLAVLHDGSGGFGSPGGLGRHLLGAVVALAAAGVVALVLWPRPASPSPELVLPRASTTLTLAAGPVAPAVPTTVAADELVVDVVGQVRAPGVYRVAPGARITDVIDAAGGLANGADRARLNLAAPVVDGERVFIPAVGQQVPPVAVGGQTAAPAAGTGGGTGGAATASAPVNINTASLDELDTLPGVGPATAQAIVDHRTQNGPFSSVEGLLDVRGIGDAKLAELRDRVVV